MILGGAAHIAHGEVKEISRDGGVGYSGRGSTHQRLSLRVILADCISYALLDDATHLGIAQGKTVVAIYGRLDA